MNKLLYQELYRDFRNLFATLTIGFVAFIELCSAGFPDFIRQFLA